MNNSLKQSMKQRLKSVAKERDLTFDEIWHNLILERFLARLCQSKYKGNFILKEFIFAEKLETVVHRGMGNTRMKDFHDLHSLISLEKCLDPDYTHKVVMTVFNHRQTQLKLPLKHDVEFIEMIQPLWHEYQKDLPKNQITVKPPDLIQDVISFINSWLKKNTQLCTTE